MLKEPHNLASVGALRAQIPTGTGGGATDADGQDASVATGHARRQEGDVTEVDVTEGDVPERDVPNHVPLTEGDVTGRQLREGRRPRYADEEEHRSQLCPT